MSARPPVLTGTPWTFPPAGRETHLSNGMRLLMYDCPGQHVIAVTLFFDVPLTVEPRHIEGIARLDRSMPDPGRRRPDRGGVRGCAGALRRRPRRVRIAGRVRRTAVGADHPPRRRSAADGRRGPPPTFIDTEFEHEQTLRLQEIEQARAYPQHVAVELLNAALFGDSARADRSAVTPDGRGDHQSRRAGLRPAVPHAGAAAA